MKKYLKENGYQVDTWTDNNDPKKPEIKDLHFENYKKEIDSIAEIEVCYVEHNDKLIEESGVIYFKNADTIISHISEEKLKLIETKLEELIQLIVR